jgi:hypothetical protein
LRVVKLRLSRKLIFVAGLLTCLQCSPDVLTADELQAIQDRGVDGLVDHLLTFVRRPPLDILAEGLVKFGTERTAIQVLNAYNEFLDRLNDPTVRKTLEELPPLAGEQDPVLAEVKRVGNRFQDGLIDLFFHDHAGVAKLTKYYGLF